MILRATNAPINATTVRVKSSNHRTAPSTIEDAIHSSHDSDTAASSALAATLTDTPAHHAAPLLSPAARCKRPSIC
jgi:hypothetical protein